jgi:predicted nucleotidyltransferase
MPQPVKLSDPLINAARTIAPDTDRSIAGQIEHWARLGQAAERVLSVEESLQLKRDGSIARNESPYAIPVIERIAEAVHEEEPPPYGDAPSGMTWAPWLERRREGIEALCRLAGVRRLAFFGSVVRERYNRVHGSDVDAIVEFIPEPQPSARRYFDFRTALAQLLAAPVDLVELFAMQDGRLKRELEATQRDFYVEPAEH